MLNEAPKKPKKEKDYSHPTRAQLFWRTQAECLRRSVTPFLMYMFMSMLALAIYALAKDAHIAVSILLTLVCIAGGAFYNGHLCYHYGKLHYGVYVAGELHRRNELFGIPSGSGHRPEREYRPWKGFLIGFYVALPAAVLAIIGGSLQLAGNLIFSSFVGTLFLMFAGWAIFPVTWFNTSVGGGLSVSLFWSLLMLLLPLLVSGIFYIVGAQKERRTREAEVERAETVAEAGRNAQRQNSKQNSQKDRQK